MPAHGAIQQPGTVHLIPSHDGWMLVSDDRGERAKHFADLGRALDAATAGDRPIHIVVHERALTA